LTFFGGEPLLCTDIVTDIARFAYSLTDENGVALDQTIISNAVLLTQKKIRLLTYAHIHKVQVTLDGSKENHDTVRLTKTGRPTYDSIFSHIKDFLAYDKMNSVYLRIHLTAETPAHACDTIKKEFSTIEEKYRKRILIYPKVIFTACTEKMSGDCKGDCLNDEDVYHKALYDDRLTKMADTINTIILELGFNSVYFVKSRFRGPCVGLREHTWLLRPDGYLTKCNVGIESERSSARLTENGIQLLPERFIRIREKIFSPRILDHCRDCSFLPFCWGGCGYKHYHNPDFDNFVKRYCFKGKISWIINDRISAYKYYYKYCLKKESSHADR
jgi:uncharacterized protein